VSPRRGKDGKNGFGRTIPDRGGLSARDLRTWEDSIVTRRRIATVLAAAAVAVSAAPAPAIDLGLGLFKRRKSNEQPPQAKPDPNQKVKQLVATVQSDPDVDRRLAAVADLRSHDPRSNTDLIPALIGCLQKDPSPDVRARAAETLGGYRSVYQSAATALETVEQNDPDQTVRAAAKSALWQYGLNGYKPAAPAVSSSTPEPPLAKPLPPSKSTGVARSPGGEPPFRPISQGPAGKGTAFPQSGEPPLAASAPPPVPSTLPPPVAVPQRMPGKLEVAEVKPPKATLPAPPLPERKPATPPKPVETNTVLPPAKPVNLAPPLPLPLPIIPSLNAAPTVKPPGR
jgi:hypothetical protein